jgi:hypothetical protein
VQSSGKEKYFRNISGNMEILIKNQKISDEYPILLSNIFVKLPETLTTFVMGNNFNQHIDLPDGLIIFEMGTNFVKPITLT